MNKNADAVEAVGFDAESLPYLQVVMKLSGGLRNAVTKTYRFYLGENSTTNFDIKRHHIYNVTLKLGYNGLDVTDEWKISGSASTDDEWFSLAYYKKRYAQPGEIFYFKCEYELNAGSMNYTYNSSSDGFMISSSSSKIAEYTDTDRNGSVTPAFDVTQLSLSSRYLLMCNNCKHIDEYMTTAEASSYLTRLQAILRQGTGSSSRYFYCKWCNSQMIDQATSEFQTGGIKTPKAGTYSKCSIFAPDNSIFKYNVSSSAADGSSITLYAGTRNGKNTAQLSIPVHAYHAATISGNRNRKPYVAQQELLTVTDWATATYGSDPTFSFSLVAYDPNGNVDSSVATLTTSGLSSTAQKRQRYVNCQKSGSYIVTVSYGGSNITTYSSVIRYPEIGYPSNASVNYAANGFSQVPNGGNVAYFTAPSYIIQDESTGNYISYTTYNSSLYSTYLGSITGTEIDSKGWITGSYSVNPCSVRLRYAYKNNAGSALVPWQNPKSERLGCVRFSPSSSNVRASDKPTCEVPIYFTNKYAGLISGVNGTYYSQVCDEADRDNSLSSSATYGDYSQAGQDFSSSEFSSTFNGSSVSFSNWAKKSDSVMYLFDPETNDITPGQYKLNLKISGSEGSVVTVPLWTVDYRRRYVGRYNLEHTYQYGDNYGTDAYTMINNCVTDDIRNNNGINNYDFKVTVTPRYVVPGFFACGSIPIYPSSLKYDPKNICKGKNDYDEFPRYSVSLYKDLQLIIPILRWGYGYNANECIHDSDAAKFMHNNTFYYSAKSTTSSSNYTIEFNRLLILDNLAGLVDYNHVGVICDGFGINNFKKFNTPCYQPASSPQTINGIVWSKISDDGTTASWRTADGYQTCTFKYGAWE